MQLIEDATDLGVRAQHAHLDVPICLVASSRVSGGTTIGYVDVPRAQAPPSSIGGAQPDECGRAEREQPAVTGGSARDAGRTGCIAVQCQDGTCAIRIRETRSTRASRWAAC